MANAKPGTQKQQTSKPAGPTFTKGSAMEFGGGRWEGGIATIISGKYGPWCYPKKPGDTSRPKHTGFGTITLREEDRTEHDLHYNAGFFGSSPEDRGYYNNAYPSRDGVYPAGPEGMDTEELLETYLKFAAGEFSPTPEELADYEGNTVVFLNNPATPGAPPPKLPKQDWTQLADAVQALAKADGNEELRAILFDENGNLKPGADNFDAFVGMRFNWIYEKQKYESKKAKEKREQSKQEKFEVLVPDQFFGMDEEWLAEQSEGAEDEQEETPKPKSTGGKVTGKKAVAPEPEPEEEEEEQEDEVEEEETEEEEQEEETEEEQEEEISADPFGDRVDLAVLKALRKLGRPAVRRDFNAIVASSFKTTEQRKVLDYLNDPKWMASKDRSFTYDKNNSTWSA